MQNTALCLMLWESGARTVISCTPSVTVRDLCCLPSAAVHWITADCPVVGGREEITTEPPQGHPGIAGGGTTANAPAGKKCLESLTLSSQLLRSWLCSHPQKNSTTATFLLKQANVH